MNESDRHAHGIAVEGQNGSFNYFFPVVYIVVIYNKPKNVISFTDMAFQQQMASSYDLYIYSVNEGEFNKIKRVGYLTAHIPPFKRKTLLLAYIER